MRTLALLDMDGVLADFMQGYHDRMVEWYGVRADFPLPDIYDLEAYYGTPPGSLQRIISGDGFFENLAPTKFASWLVKECYLRFDDVAVLTAYHPRIREKRRWLEIHFPSLVPKLIMGDEKSLLARPGAVLFDDLKDHCEAFREAEGEAILIPSRYGQTDYTIRSIFTSSYTLDNRYPRKQA